MNSLQCLLQILRNALVSHASTRITHTNSITKEISFKMEFTPEIGRKNRLSVTLKTEKFCTKSATSIVPYSTKKLLSKLKELTHTKVWLNFKKILMKSEAGLTTGTWQRRTLRVLSGVVLSQIQRWLESFKLIRNSVPWPLLLSVYL